MAMYMYNWHQLSIPVEWVVTGYKSKFLTAKAVDYFPEINHKILSIVLDWFNILYYISTLYSYNVITVL